MAYEATASQGSADPRLGTFVTRTVAGEEVRAFVPLPLPADPPIELTGPRLGTSKAADRPLVANGAF